MTATRTVDPGQSGERTALAWTRSTLSLAVNGGLVVRATFTAGLPVVGVALAVTLAPAVLLVWRHGQEITPGGRRPGPGVHHQTQALRALTLLTLCTAAIAAILTMVA